MKTKLLGLGFFLIFTLSTSAFAKPLNFYFISPHDEGSSDAAKPYIDNFLEILSQKTGQKFEGAYLNSLKAAEEAIAKNQFDLAIVSSDFYASHSPQKITSLLKTIPLHSAGPFETYSIVGLQSADLSSAKLKIVSSRSLPQIFQQQILSQFKIQNPKIEPSTNIVDSLILATTDANILVALNDSELSAYTQMQNDFAELKKLSKLHTSAPLPSPQLVKISSQTTPDDFEKIINALIGLSNDPAAKSALETLRLKGFSK